MQLSGGDSCTPEQTARKVWYFYRDSQGVRDVKHKQRSGSAHVPGTQLGQLCTGSETLLLPIHSQTAMVPCATAKAYRSAATSVLAGRETLPEGTPAMIWVAKQALGVTL